MNLRVTRIVAAKEIRETLRDRRTLVMAVLVPVVLYPALIVGIAQLGRDLVAEDGVERVPVAIVGHGGIPQAWRTRLLGHEDLLVRHLAADWAALELAALDGGQGGDEERARALAVFARTDLRAILAFGADTAARLAAEEPVTARIWVNEAYAATRARAQRAFADTLTELAEAERDRRLRDRGVPVAIISPLDLQAEGISAEASFEASFFSGYLVLLVLMLIASNALHPAMDMTAGEKERGTLQTLLTAPVARGDLVRGKFVAVSFVALLTAAVHITSMGLTYWHAASLLDIDLSSLPRLTWRTWLGLFAGVFVMGMLYSAMVMVVAVLARSYKEAQTWVTPLYVVALVPIFVSQLGGVELTGLTAALPVIGVGVWLRLLLSGGIESVALSVWAFAATLGWVALLLRVAGGLFAREDVVLGEGLRWGQGGVRALLSPAGADGSGCRPTAGQALALFGVVFALLYYVGGALQTWQLLAGVAATLWLVLLPALLVFLRVERLSPGASLAWRWPVGLRAWLGALLVGCGAWLPLSVAVESLQNRYLPLPPEVAQQLAGLLEVPDSPLGTLWLVFAVAITPAVVEELIFRGAILEGLRRSLGDRRGNLLTALLFAAMHMSIHRFVGTAALGWLAGHVRLRCGAIGPAIALHALNNAMLVLVAKSGALGEDAAATEAPLGAVAAALVCVVVGLAVLSSLPRKPLPPTPERS